MAVISTRHDFATEITIDGWFVTEFDCHVILPPIQSASTAIGSSMCMFTQGAGHTIPCRQDAMN